MPAQRPDRFEEEVVAGRERVRVQREWGSRRRFELGYRSAYQIDGRIDGGYSQRGYGPMVLMPRTASSWYSIG